MDYLKSHNKIPNLRAKTFTEKKLKKVFIKKTKHKFKFATSNHYWNNNIKSVNEYDDVHAHLKELDKIRCEMQEKSTNITNKVNDIKNLLAELVDF
jgi:hypothetical protein